MGNLTEDLDLNGYKVIGNQVYLDSESDVIVDLGDTAGGDNFQVRNSNGIAKLTLDSQGNLSIEGDLNGVDFDDLVAKLNGIESLADKTTASSILAAGGVLSTHLNADLSSITLPEDLVISSFAKTVLDSVDASSFRTAIQAEQLGSLYVPDASQTEKGRIEIATQAEVNSGTDNTKAVTPNTLTNWVQAAPGSSNTYVHPDHTGDVSSASGGATTLESIAITGKESGLPVAGDIIIFADANDDFALKKAAIEDLSGATVPAATTATQGIIELATQVEADLGTDNTRAITPATLKNFVGFEGGVLTVPDSSKTVKGKIELATQTETNEGTDDVRAVTPKMLKNYSRWDDIDGGEDGPQLYSERFVIFEEDVEVVSSSAQITLFAAPYDMQIERIFAHTWDRDGNVSSLKFHFDVELLQNLEFVDDQVDGIRSYGERTHTPSTTLFTLDKLEKLSLRVTNNGSSGSPLPEGLEVYLEWSEIVS